MKYKVKINSSIFCIYIKDKGLTPKRMLDPDFKCEATYTYDEVKRVIKAIISGYDSLQFSSFDKLNTEEKLEVIEKGLKESLSEFDKIQPLECSEDILEI